MRWLLTLTTAACLGISGVGPVVAQTAGEEMEDFDLRIHETPAGPLEWRLHLPSAGEASALMVVLHGCLQDAADVATGTRMNATADMHGFAVLYPQQSVDRNPQRCWNWFTEGADGVPGAETGMLASLVDDVATDLGVDPGSTYVAGISAGAAMAANLAVAHPALFDAVIMHSGIPWGAADDMAAGLAAMQSGGPEKIDLADPALEAFLGASAPSRFVVVHGAEDPVVRPVNGERGATRWVRLLNERARRAGEAAMPDPVERSVNVGDGSIALRVWTGGGATVWLTRVPGLGHAWSGGSAEGTYTDPATVSATDLIVTLLGLRR
jgi:poly(hydroxyalkanoate) depolymerase family esterase